MMEASRRITALGQRRGAPIDSGAEENEVGTQHGLDKGQWDGGRLIDDQQLCLPQPLVVLRLYVLNRLHIRDGHRSGSTSETSSTVLQACRPVSKWVGTVFQLQDQFRDSTGIFFVRSVLINTARLRKLPQRHQAMSQHT